MSLKRTVKRQSSQISEASYTEGFRVGFREGHRAGVMHHAKIMEKKLLTLSEVKGIGEKTFLKILLHLNYQEKPKGE